MDKFLLAIAFALSLGQFAGAQSPPQWQIYGAGSYGHADVSPPLPGISKVNSWGYNIGVEEYVNRWIGGVAEFGDYYRKPVIDMRPFGLPGLKERVRTHFTYLMGGPQVRHSFGNFTPFGRAMLGFSRRIFNDQNGFISSDENAVAFGTGGGVDIRLRPHIALRPLEADYVLTNFAGDRQGSWKVSAGVVFHWGQR